MIRSSVRVVFVDARPTDRLSVDLLWESDEPVDWTFTSDTQTAGGTTTCGCTLFK